MCGHIIGLVTIVSWCIIETQDSDMSFLMLFTTIKLGKFESVPTSFELQAANLQEAVGEARDTLMNTSPSQSVINVCETFGKFVKFTVEIFRSNSMYRPD